METWKDKKLKKEFDEASKGEAIIRIEYDPVTKKERIEIKGTSAAVLYRLTYALVRVQGDILDTFSDAVQTANEMRSERKRKNNKNIN